MNQNEIPVKGELIAEGKTKLIYAIEGDPYHVIMSNIDNITKNDDPTATKVMSGKAVCATQTTKATFKLLQDAGLPVAYNHEMSEGLPPNEFVAVKLNMIKLEVVIRRDRDGSDLKRNPYLKRPKGMPLLRSHRLIFELFLKTTNGQVLHYQMPIDQLEPAGSTKPVDDPLIINPYDIRRWTLQHPKMPAWEKGSAEGFPEINVSGILPEGVSVALIEELARKAFLVLEAAWKTKGCNIVDYKIELGLDINGKLWIGDVVDNDSWRVRFLQIMSSGGVEWKELSKQLFRDNHDLSEVQEKYELVSQLVKSFRIPRQVVVIWKGSKHDFFELPIVAVQGVKIVEVVLSGHKNPTACLLKFEEIINDYPEGGVIIAYVGLSNGLGPMLAARSSWPVIAVPATVDKNDNDVWSSLNMPSQVPLLTVLSPKNAWMAALNHLASNNPAAYMTRQYAIEELEK